ncbi:hypothetical protein [Arthrobacter psychrolactophilus]
MRDNIVEFPRQFRALFLRNFGGCLFGSHLSALGLQRSFALKFHGQTRRHEHQRCGEKAPESCRAQR